MHRFKFLLLLMLSFFGCFRKKTPPDTIQSWLETEFPGQFEILDSNLKMLDIMAQFKGQKQALVADKTDQEVQFFLDWTKGVPGLGVDQASVQSKLSEARQETAKARVLFKALESNGLEQFSIGLIQKSVYVLVFAEPGPELRTKTLKTVLDCLDQQPNPEQSRVVLEFMEPGVYQTRFKEIIPRGDWVVEQGFLRENKILSINFEYEKGRNAASIQPQWTLNPESTRAVGFHQRSFEQAQKWAEQHLPKPYFMEDGGLVSFEPIDGTKPGIRYGFPYFLEKPADEAPEPVGYVVVDYDFDQKTCLKMKKQKEF